MRFLIILLSLAIPLVLGAAQPGKPAKELKATNIERLNTPADDDDPCLAGDGLSFYFTSKLEDRKVLMLAMRRALNQNFVNAKPIEELAGKRDSVAPYSLGREADGSEYLYFAGQRDGTNFDIYFARRLRPSEPFMRIAVAPVHPVCTPEDECDPCVMPDELSMFFSRKTREGWRVGYAHGKDRRAFDRVELLDLPPGFWHPTVSKDGLTMYLHGPVEQGKDKLGIFVSRRANKNAKWSAPDALEALSHKDSVKGDCSPRLSADGVRLYFASDRPGGKGGLDLYYVTTSELKRAL